MSTRPAESQPGLFGVDIAHDRRSRSRRASTRQGGRRRTDKLACPACGSFDNFVVPSHMTLEQQLTGNYWRRRRCEACQAIFETEESVKAGG